MPQLLTTKGYVAIASLARTVVFEDRPDEMVVAEEFRLDGELVKRNAHVIKKDPGVEAAAVAGTF